MVPPPPKDLGIEGSQKPLLSISTVSPWLVGWRGFWGGGVGGAGPMAQCSLRAWLLWPLLFDLSFHGGQKAQPSLAQSITA